MKIIKLLIISFIAFYCLFWAFSLLLPSSSIVSRAANSSIKKDSLKTFFTNKIALQKLLLDTSNAASVSLSERNYFENDQKINHRELNSDTIFFKMQMPNQKPLQGGLALYTLTKDSTGVQLFYTFRASWYKPWEKFKMIFKDEMIGNSLENALLRIPK